MQFSHPLADYHQLARRGDPQHSVLYPHLIKSGRSPETSRQYVRSLKRLLRALPHDAGPTDTQTLASVLATLPPYVNRHCATAWPVFTAWAVSVFGAASPLLPAPFPALKRQPRAPASQGRDTCFQCDPLPYEVVTAIGQIINFYPQSVRALARVKLSDFSGPELREDFILDRRTRQPVPESTFRPLIDWTLGQAPNAPISPLLLKTATPVLGARPLEAKLAYPLHVLQVTMMVFALWERGLYFTPRLGGMTAATAALPWEETIALVWRHQFPRHFAAWRHRVEHRVSAGSFWLPRERTLERARTASWGSVDSGPDGLPASGLWLPGGTPTPVASAASAVPSDAPTAPVAQATRPPLPQAQPSQRVQLEEVVTGLPVPPPAGV
jgi:hypothetical protein